MQTSGDQITVGNIMFSTAIPSTTVPLPPVDTQGFALRTSFVYLIELFAVDGTSRGIYWAGRSNRIAASVRGVEVTREAFKARRIPLDCKDLADDIADALNKLHVAENRDQWCVTEHGFL